MRCRTEGAEQQLSFVLSIRFDRDYWLVFSSHLVLLFVSLLHRSFCENLLPANRPTHSPPNMVRDNHTGHGKENTLYLYNFRKGVEKAVETWGQGFNPNKPMTPPPSAVSPYPNPQPTTIGLINSSSNSSSISPSTRNPKSSPASSFKADSIKRQNS